MGRLIGRAVTLGQQIVEVVFSGDSVSDGELPEITGISIQMDGGADYMPLKTTTASIGF